MAEQTIGMATTNRFKQDFSYYLLGIIVPSLLNAALIPIIKHLLGTEVFGAYSLKFNFLLLLQAILIGGIFQSVIRFKVDAENNLSAFYAQVFLLIRHLLIPVTIVCFFVLLLYFHETVLLSFAFTCCVVGGSLHNILTAIAQANFQSKFIMLSEGVRALSFFLFSILALSFINIYSQELLLLSLFLSYCLSIILLASKNKLSFIKIIGVFKSKNVAFDTKIFLKYGFPLSLWFAIYYLFTYVDKPLLANDFGFQVQGNYQALFDIIFRGITAIMSPFLIAVFPIITQAFQHNKKGMAFNLLRQLILLQIILTTVGSIIYWFWGFNMLAKILAIPFTNDYKLSGLLMIIACMIWQISMLNQNFFKLIKRTDLVLKFMFISLAFFIANIAFIKLFKQDKFYFYTLPFLTAGLIYNLFCVGYLQLKKIFIAS